MILARNRPVYQALVTIAGILLAFGLALLLYPYLQFPYHPSGSGIIGWISVHQYPKGNEFFYFIVALVGLPASICLAWWLSGSRPSMIYPTSFLADEDDEQKRIHTPGSRSDTSLHPIMSWVLNVLIALRRPLVYLLVPVLIYVLHYSGWIHGDIDLFHEGERLAPLNEMLHRGIPYGDIYLQHGLFQNAYLSWTASKAFGPTLEGLRRLERILDPLGYISLYFLGTQVFRRRLLFACLTVLVSSAEHTSISPRHSLGLLSLAVTAGYLHHQRQRGIFAGWQPFHHYQSDNTPGWRKLLRFCLTFGWRLILAGIFSSLAFWYSTEIGLYTTAATGIFLFTYSLQPSQPLNRRPIPLICYGAGFLVGFLPISVYFIWHGALDDLVRNTYIQTKYQIDTWGLKFPGLMEILHQPSWKQLVLSEGFRWYLPIILFLITISYLTHQWLCRRLWTSISDQKLLLILLGGTAFFRTALGRSDGGHLVYGSTFVWLLICFFFDHIIGRLVYFFRRKQWITFGLISILVLNSLIGVSWYANQVHRPLKSLSAKWHRLWHRPAKPVIERQLARAGQVQIPEHRIDQIEQVVEYIQSETDSEECIFDFTSQGAYYFFANRPSASRYHQVAYASTPEMQQEIVEALEVDQTQLVIFKTGGWFDNIDGIPSEERHPVVARYLSQHYRLATDINGVQILKRKSAKEKQNENY